jgi:hypothetical protein
MNDCSNQQNKNIINRHTNQYFGSNEEEEYFLVGDRGLLISIDTAISILLNNSRSEGGSI